MSDDRNTQNMGGGADRGHLAAQLVAAHILCSVECARCASPTAAAPCTLPANNCVTRLRKSGVGPGILKADNAKTVPGGHLHAAMRGSPWRQDSLILHRRQRKWRL